MTIVKTQPANVDDIDFKDPMRHPMGGDASNGMWLSDTEPPSVDTKKLRDGRLDKLRAWMAGAGYGGVILLDPYNQRYATGTRNMFGYFLRNSTRYFFIPVQGPIVLFDYPQSYHVSACVDTVSEVRPSKLVWSSVSGRDNETAGPFAAEIAELMRAHGGGSTKVGMDRCSHIQALALEKRGLQVVDCQGEILAVRAIKTPEEVQCLQISMAGAESAVAAVRDAVKPGVTEIDLFAVMYQEVIRQGGEFIETRLLTSGQRTNPWFNEASGRRVRPGELVALDTDMIGCFGYFSDFSRTFRCGPGRATGYQKMLYRMSYDQIQHNVDIIRPGLSFREIADKAWRIPAKFVDQRYTSVMHGVGMHGETPFIAHAIDFATYGREGILMPGMVVSVESYIGEKNGREGVKLEEEVLVTEAGPQVISRFPFEDELLETQI
ncbi:MAG TPA: Xaa-Pro peptidase family protein [Dongiaceae bacterium]|jgi:Xaa-Pro aminopeptidase|nr:Xaa-Pro peptidase family protein [Dongiaceae bacterium]